MNLCPECSKVSFRLTQIPQRGLSTTLTVFPNHHFQGVKCYSCGSLFNLNSAATCETFDRNNKMQRKTCQPGEGCLLYTWTKSANEIGEDLNTEEKVFPKVHRLIVVHQEAFASAFQPASSSDGQTLLSMSQISVTSKELRWKTFKWL